MDTILVVDDMPIFREPMEAALSSAGYHVLTAPSGEAALAVMAEQRPRLVVLDISMPGMNGLEVLTQMRQKRALKDVPVLILSAMAERDMVVQAAKLGISGYVLKTSFSLKDLLEKVRALIPEGEADPEHRPSPVAPSQAPSTRPASVKRGAPAASPHRDEPERTNDLKPLMTRSEVLDRIKACEELKGFSPTVSQVLSMTSRDNCSLDQVSKAITQDQAMALKILKVANSSIYSRGDRVDTVHKAVLRIGMDSIRQAVLNIGVVERFGSAAFSERLSTQQFWEHSIACGLIGAEVAHAQGTKDADTAFTCGLLHDLGRVMLAEALGGTYIEVLDTARRLGAPLEAVESRQLVLNHADVMDRLLIAWKFPKHLIDPILHHHLSAGSVRGVTPSRVADVLRLGLADRLAHAMLLGNSGNEIIYPTHEHCRGLGLNAATMRSIEETARQQTDDTKFALLSSTNGGAWPRRVEEVRAMLQSAFRPIFVSGAPEFDAYRIFCNSLAEPRGDHPPNIGVVHVASAKESETLAEGLLAGEKEAGVAGLPLLVLTAGAKYGLPEGMVGQRRCERIITPVPVERFLQAVDTLLLDARRAAA